MDSRAKQRLTGAIILVALFVLLVPELLTGPKDGAGDTPSEEGIRRYTIDLDAPAGSVQPATPSASQPAVALPPVVETPPPATEARALPGEAARPEAVAAQPAAPPVTVTTTAKPAPNPASSPAPVAATTPAPAPRVETPHVESPRPAPVASGAYAVQLGSFVSKENAERLVREMTTKGFNAFVAPPITTGGRALYRVRVGPTRDRAAAEALAAQLRRIGQVGSIVSIS